MYKEKNRASGNLQISIGFLKTDKNQLDYKALTKTGLSPNIDGRAILMAGA